MYRSRTTLIALAALSAVSAPSALFAGPLAPAAGPVAPTMKTLSEVEPRIAINATNTPGDANSLYRITQPGSYYLTGNVVGVAAKDGIDVESSGVTIDLNGFELRGVPGSADGITCNAIGNTNITVRNGSIRSWGEDGIDLFQAQVKDVRIEQITSSGNTGRGIRVDQRATFTDCIADNNGFYGFDTNSTCIFNSCTANYNTFRGFDTGGLCTLNNCISSANATGYHCSTFCTLTNCCSSYNSEVGIALTADCLVSGCNVQSNTGGGITCGARCNVTGNICNANGTAATLGGGIVVGSLCLVEGNSCNSNQKGIQATGANNVIEGNTCHANTVNWQFVANNVFGQIVDRTAPGSPAVAGNSAASSMGTTDSRANITN